MADAQLVGGKYLLGTTANGKQIFYGRKDGKSVRFIEFGDGGEVPYMLSGGYNSIRAAQSQVDAYLAQKEPKVKKKKAKA